VCTFGWSDAPRVRLIARRAISRMISVPLSLRSSRFLNGMPASALVFAPHPDDESLGCGGTMALMARSGVDVHVAFVTDGRASHPHHSVVTPSEIAARRISEARSALGILGIDWDHASILGALDGGLAQLSGGPRQELVSTIARLAARLRPEAVMLPCGADGSSEHDAAYVLVCQALGESGLRPRILEFPVWSWWNPLLLVRAAFSYRKIWRVDLGDTRNIKARAIASYISQTLPVPPDGTSALPQGFASMFLGDKEFLLER
jgi:LmbE family N-acetylglucosaminyl deacetylase